MFQKIANIERIGHQAEGSQLTLFGIGFCKRYLKGSYDDHLGKKFIFFIEQEL